MQKFTTAPQKCYLDMIFHPSTPSLYQALEKCPPFQRVWLKIQGQDDIRSQGAGPLLSIHTARACTRSKLDFLWPQ